MKRAVWILVLALLLTGCTAAPSESTPTGGNVPATVPTPTQPDLSQFSGMNLHADTDALFSKRDYDATYSGDTTVTLDGTIIRCTGSGVTVSGNTATITQAGTYILTGTLTNGSIRVDTDKQSKVQLVLQDASIHSANSVPLCILQADKTFVTLVGSNRLSCGSSLSAAPEGADAPLFSKDDLTLNGSGSLTVESPIGHGIVSKNDLTVTDGTYHITAAKHGISADDSLCIASGSFTVASGKDALRCDTEEADLGFVYIRGGQFALTADGDGISATSTLQIDGGVFAIMTGGGSDNGKEHTEDMPGGPGWMGGQTGRPGPGGPIGGPGTPPSPGGNHQSSSESDSVSCKGLKADGDILVRAGNFSMNCADDAIHGKKNVTLLGDSFAIATGDDALHADAQLTIGGGAIAISQSYEGMEAQSIRILGGEITLKSSDDGLNAAGGNDGSGNGEGTADMFGVAGSNSIEISGGTLFVDAGGDGMDSNGNLFFSGGYVVVEGPTNGGNGPLDYGGSAIISGGTLIVTGSIQMAQPIRPKGQGALNLSVGNQAAGTTVTVTDSEGNTVITFTPGKSFACVIVSTPGLVSGQTYHVAIGATTGEIAAD